LEQRIYDHLPKKVRRLEHLCERLQNDKYYLPQLHPLKPDALKEQVYAALADGPKTKKELAGMFRKSVGVISNAGLRLRNEGEIASGAGASLCGCVPPRQPALFLRAMPLSRH
jgi:hypothetical protein